MATRRTQPTGIERRPCRQDRALVRGENKKKSARGGCCDDWASVKRHGWPARGRGLGDRVRVWQDHGTYTGCGHEARSARGHAQGSGRATYKLRDGDEADAADRERTAAVPAKWGARQRRETERDRTRRILRLGTSEETCRASEGTRSGRSCEGVARPRDVHGVLT